MTYKNIAFRNKNMKGAKVDDLYLYLEEIKEFADRKTVENIQRFIEREMNYKPVKKEMAK